MRLNTLAEIDKNALHKAFVAAFSDYQIKQDLAFSRFANFLIRRGFDPDLSIGAFSGGRLCGFVLNGCRIFQGISTLYDLGTGVIPEFRKQGISSQMFQRILCIIQGTEARRYLLEVLTPNVAAIELYRKQGFTISRNFACFKISKNSLSLQKNCQVETLRYPGDEFWTQASRFWNWNPSWQNSIDSIQTVVDDFHLCIVKSSGIFTGYGIIDKKTGDIPQLAVRNDSRNRGIGSSILAELIQHSESHEVFMSNIDASDDSMISFLQQLKFAHVVDQYEMILQL
jgi:ribosomal protein S18 acetylase RimI-like enzyme